MCIRITRIYYPSVIIPLWKKKRKKSDPEKVCNKNKCLSFVYISQATISCQRKLRSIFFPRPTESAKKPLCTHLVWSWSTKKLQKTWRNKYGKTRTLIAQNRTTFYDININFMTRRSLGKPGKGNKFYALWPKVRTTNSGAPSKLGELRSIKSM